MSAAEKEGSLHVVCMGNDKYMVTWADYAVPGARAAKARMCVGQAGVDDFLGSIGVDATERTRVASSLDSNQPATVGLVRLTEQQLKQHGLV